VKKMYLNNTITVFCILKLTKYLKLAIQCR